MDDLATSFDGEINPQTIPPVVWATLTRLRQDAHTAPMHRGHFSDRYYAYLDGAADALGLDRGDLDEVVRLG